MEKRILVVDDDDAIRTLLFTVLRRRGFKVDVARNGVEAVEKCAECLYAMVLLDLMMPRMSGWEVLDTLALQPVQTRPVVLVLTAGLEPRNLDTTIVAGMMHKPFDIDLLLDTVAGCLTSVAGRVQSASCPAPDSDGRALVRGGTPGDAN
ncbi:MAG: two-component system, OmpR family, response regulator CpxR [Acidobacteriota bacterium]|jgi:DNA-binding response OmpR family regulator|nr:two-component system, OmpR family, response regulator CpxR [Acidobacteriota bacterium]